jgi:hypothetical protein
VKTLCVKLYGTFMNITNICASQICDSKQIKLDCVTKVKQHNCTHTDKTGSVSHADAVKLAVQCQKCLHKNFQHDLIICSHVQYV